MESTNSDVDVGGEEEEQDVFSYLQTAGDLSHNNTDVTNEEGSDDGMEWDEVEADTQETGDGIEVVLQDAAKNRFLSSKRIAAGKKKTTAVDRALRLSVHKAHTLSLLFAGAYRNHQINDDELQARLLSLCPAHLLNNFTAFNKTTHPNERDRSRCFDNALKEIISWWWRSFAANRTDSDTGLPMGITSRSWEEVEQDLAKLSLKDKVAMMKPAPEADAADKSKKKKKAKPAAPEESTPFIKTRGDVIRNVNSLARRALNMAGSPDIKAQLFAALCRAAGVPTRLVFSLQSVEFRAPNTAKAANRAGETKPKKPKSAKAKGKARATDEDTTMAEDEEEQEESPDEMDEVPVSAIPAHLAYEETSPPRASSSKRPIKKPTLRANGTLSKPISVPSSRQSSTNASDRDNGPPVRLRKPRLKKEGSVEPDAYEKTLVPVWWTEHYSRYNREWIPVDVTRKMMRCAPKMEPSENNDGGARKLVYVVAYEEDLSAKDVTTRYAKFYNTRTLKARPPKQKKNDEDWWEESISIYKRKYDLTRDRVEEEELRKQVDSEEMPKILAGFKNHPKFVLERHLKREEHIPPKTKQVGTFRGEPVFPRAAVLQLKSAEQYMREGLKVKEGEQPLKSVKMRAVTLEKRRMLEAAKEEGREEVQGLYSKSQTEEAIPDPVIDGKVPKNAYGNIDLFAPHMLPRGASHLPYKGIAKVARKLGVDFGEAVTGFEFRKQRANPTITGIVVPTESANIVLDAYWETQHATAEKEFRKKQERCQARWRKLVKAIRLGDRLRETYKPVGEDQPLVNGKPIEGPSQFRANDAPELDMVDLPDPQPVSATAPAPNSFRPPSPPTGDYGGGGFMAEDDAQAGGGFLPGEDSLSSPPKDAARINGSRKRKSEVISDQSSSSEPEAASDDDFEPVNIPVTKPKTRGSRNTSKQETAKRPRRAVAIKDYADLE